MGPQLLMEIRMQCSRLPTTRITAGHTSSSENAPIDEELNKIPIIADRIIVCTNSDSLCSRVLQFVQTGWPGKVKDVQLKPFATRKDEL